MVSRFMKSLLFCVALLLPVYSQAAEYPERNVQVIIHAKAGAGMDMFCRALSKSLEGIFPKPLIIENRPGGGSAVAVTYVATHKDPGYAWLAVTNTHLITPIKTKTPFSLQDMKPVAQLVSDPTVLVTSADSPWKTAKDLMDDVKKNPGQISCAIAQVGSLEHYMLLQLKKQGYDMKPLPFESGTEAVVSIIGGHTSVGFSEPSEVESQIRAGKLRVLAVCTPERIESMPDVPTAKEQGYDIATAKFRGIMVNKDTPDEVVAIIDSYLRKALETDVLKDYIRSAYMFVDYKGPEEFGKYLDALEDENRAFLTEVGQIKQP